MIYVADALLSAIGLIVYVTEKQEPNRGAA
jgi:hypothetical protein